MAEEVKIVDVAGGPAAEATLQELLKTMKQMAAKSGSGSGAANEAQKQYNESIKKGTTAQKDKTSAVKDSTESLNIFSASLDRINRGFGLIGSLLGNTAGVLTNFAGAITSATTIGEVLEAVPVFGSVLSSATGYFQTSVETFRQLSEVGAGFGNDMMAIRNASAEAGLNLSQFTEVISNNSRNMNLLGETVSQGAGRFGRLSRELRQQEAGLLDLGLTQEQVNEGLMDYVEMTARTGRLRGRSDQSLIQGAQNYIAELDKLARLTGRSRSELQSEMDARRQQANINILMANMTQEGAERFERGLQFSSELLGQSGQVFSGALGDMADGVAQTPLARTLAANVDGLADLQVAYANQRISEEEYQNQMANVMIPRMLEFSQNMGAAGVTALEGREGLGEFAAMTADIRQATQRRMEMENAAAEQTRRAPSLTSIFSNFEQTIQNVRSTFEDALIDSKILPFVGEKLGELGDTLVKYAGEVGSLFAEYLGSEQFKQDFESFQQAVTNIKDRISEFLEQVKADGFWNAVKGLFDSDGSDGGMLGMVGDWLSDVLYGMLPGIDTLIIGALGAIGGILAAGLLGPLVGPIAAPFLAIGGALAAIFGWETVKGWVSDGWESIKEVFTGIQTWWQNLDFFAPITNAWNSVTGLFSGVKDWWDGLDFMTPLTNAWNSVTGLFSGVKDWWDGLDFMTPLTNAWNTITGFFSFGETSFSISQLASDAWDSVTGWFSISADLVTGIAGLASSAWETVTGWFTFGEGEGNFSLSGLVSDAWNTITGFFSFEGMELPSISSLFQGVVDSVRNFFNFDFELPDFSAYLPTWLGGEGRSLSELIGGGAEATTQLAESTATAGEPITIQAPQNAVALGGLDFTTANEGALELQATLSNISAMQDFNTELERIQAGLDADNVDDYKNAMERLVDTLEDLNEVLAEDNRGVFGGGTGVSAASVIGGGIGGSDQQLTRLDQLNTTMTMLLQELRDNTEYNRRTSRAIRAGDNLQG